MNHRKRHAGNARLEYETLEPRHLLTTWTVPLGTDGEVGSLRSILELANANGEDDTLQLTAGTYELSIEGIDRAGLAGDLDLFEEGHLIHIRGAGVGVTMIDAGQLDRIFDVYAGVTVTISDLTLRGGYSETQGGAIRNAGELLLQRVDVQSNESIYGGAVFNSGRLTSVDSSFTDNLAEVGGGLLNIGEMEIRSSHIAGNTADVAAGVWNGVALLPANPQVNNVALEYSDLYDIRLDYMSFADTGLLMPVSTPESGAFGFDIQAGTLTAGTIDDYEDAAELVTFVADTLATWGNQAANVLAQEPIVIHVENGNGQAVGNSHVVIRDQAANTLMDAYTGSDGRTIFLPAVDAPNVPIAAKFELTVTGPTGEVVTQTVSTNASEWNITLDTEVQALPEQLDIALVIDVTGSMGDELEYLKVEIDSIAERIHEKHPGTDMRFALVAYRDTGDEFVTRTYDFVGHVDEFQATLMDHFASGGGDYPEAMHTALQAAGDLTWRDGNTARMLFLVADAPPHSEHVNATMQSVLNLRAQDVRVFPVAASGAANEAEMTMRTAAYVTGGEFLFLTDHSGVGLPHALPNTDSYDVEHLDQAMIRMVRQELMGRKLEPVNVIEHVDLNPQADTQGGTLAIQASVIEADSSDALFHRDGITLLSRSTVVGGARIGDGFRQLSSTVEGRVTGEVTDLANDLNGDGIVTPHDALIAINQLNRASSLIEQAPTTDPSEPVPPIAQQPIDPALETDTTRDINPLRVLQIFNDLDHEKEDRLIEEGPLDFLMATLVSK